MKKFAIALTALTITSIALAAPVLRLTSSAASNGRVLGEVVNIAAYSQLPILTRSNSGKSVVLVYKGKDAAEPFKFYQGAFEKQGWKVSQMMGGDSMGGAMDKPAAAMDKPSDGAMTGGTMDKPADTMGSTMNKGLEASLTWKNFSLTLKSSLVGTDQIKVSFDLK